MTAWRIPEQGFTQGDTQFGVAGKKDKLEIVIIIDWHGRIFEFDHSGRCIAMRIIDPADLDKHLEGALPLADYDHAEALEKAQQRFDNLLANYKE